MKIYQIELVTLMVVVPVVNENDTVATAELCFGDNDTLAALVANLINADVMVILTDQHGLYNADPRHNSDAELISLGSAKDNELTKLAGTGSSLGRGGMQTKLSAAKLADRSGTSTIIANGAVEDILLKLRAGEEIGTLLVADSEPVAARKQWLAGQLVLSGTLKLDSGAVKVLQHDGKSLLAVGIKGVTGQFARGDVVACLDESGEEVARGLVNYDYLEVNKLKGSSSKKIEQLLGYAGEEEIIHRDNLVLIP
jgi:glutamate 5-kinase